ncbi:DUF5906 domain-containing protein [Gammaproteobacteria bacterium]|nr:DUF5906 domain-containing protein [Gammaproteobacteria bacterium]
MAQLLEGLFTTTRELGAGMVNVTALPNQASTAAVSALAALQQAFAISRIGGQLRLVDRQVIREAQQGSLTAAVHFIKKQDADLILKRFIESLPIPVVKPAEVVNSFWVSPNTIEYHRLAFHPIPQSADTLNLWVSHTVVPTQGCWKIIEDYLVDVICAGDLALFDYLIRFLAHALQCPEEKPGIMIVLIGAEGVGKGFLVRLLEALWSATTLQVSDIAAITGNFNAGLERAFWVALDECMFKGDKKSQDRMKSLVTEPAIQVEQKYEPSRTIESFHRFIACTNHAQWGQIRSDDRRYLFIKVSDCHKQDTKYFGKLSNALNDGVTVPGLAHYLVNLDITNFNPRSKPQTAEGFEQKRRSLSGFARYWYEVLDKGSFDLGGDHYTPESMRYEDEVFVTSHGLTKKYKDYNHAAERYEAIQAKTIREEIKGLCPSADTSKRQDNKRGILFPEIGVARKEFETYIGSTVNWDE